MITIILTSYNRPLFVTRAIDSMKAQTSDNWRLIIADDNSNDETKQAIKQAAGNHPNISIKWYETTREERPQKTRYAVLINDIMPEIDTALVGYMCDNVEYHPDMVATVTAYFEAHPDTFSGYVLHERDMWTADGTKRLGSAGEFHHWDITPPVPGVIRSPMGLLDHSQVFHRLPIDIKWEESTEVIKYGDGVFFSRMVSKYGSIQQIAKQVLSYEHLIK